VTIPPAERLPPAIVLLGPRATATAGAIAGALGGGERWAPACAACAADARFTKVADALRELFLAGRPIVALCAAGIVVRALAPVLADKRREPPVVVVAEDGSAVVPLLGGHRGANALARRIAAALGARAAVTTASDAAFGLALDTPPPGWRLADPRMVAPFTATLLEGRGARLVVEAGDPAWLRAGDLPLDEAGPLELYLTHRALPPAAGRLVLHPPVLALGVGAERGAPAQALIDLARATLAAHGLAPEAVACVVSLDLKAAEPAVHALAADLDVPARFLGVAALLAETARLASPSEAVLRATGCWGVAEGAALAAAGPAGTLIVPKTAGARVTCAVALAPDGIDPGTAGHARGRVAVVGLGPGAPADRTRRAETAIRAAEDVVGYRLYLDLAADLTGGAAIHAFELGQEEARCRHALDLAAAGRSVALLASGDPGIYAMASLVAELVATAGRADWQRVALEVVPGVSAMQAAAAAVGAPLGHDFAVLSLSDLLTPWPLIERRIEAAAAADLVLALYNPVSARRRDGLAVAKAILLHHRGAATPVVLARNLGRPGERVRAVRLVDLAVDDADMLTVLIVGSSATRAVDAVDGVARVYTPRGYPVRP
jgi:cobalt-precorrin 5A hydrolase/precorrin-3B C17-methyltransferase